MGACALGKRLTGHRDTTACIAPGHVPGMAKRPTARGTVPHPLISAWIHQRGHCGGHFPQWLKSN